MSCRCRSTSASAAVTALVPTTPVFLSTASVEREEARESCVCSVRTSVRAVVTAVIAVAADLPDTCAE